MNVLGLDLGTTTGWALSENGIISSGIWNLGVKADPGAKYAALIKNLISIHERGIDYVVYEQPHHRGGAATNQLVGMAAIVQLFCNCSDIPVSHVHSLTLKKWATGSGRSDKAAMINAADNRWGKGLDADNNEVDAMFVCAWGCENFAQVAK